MTSEPALAVGAMDLDELRIVDVHPERLLDGVQAGPVTVRGELDAMAQPVREAVF